MPARKELPVGLFFFLKHFQCLVCLTSFGREFITELVELGNGIVQCTPCSTVRNTAVTFRRRNKTSHLSSASHARNIHQLSEKRDVEARSCKAASDLYRNVAPAQLSIGITHIDPPSYSDAPHEFDSNGVMDSDFHYDRQGDRVLFSAGKDFDQDAELERVHREIQDFRLQEVPIHTVDPSLADDATMPSEASREDDLGTYFISPSYSMLNSHFV